MKTAMQELINKIQYSIDKQSGLSITKEQENTLEAIKLVAESLLEKEKEQIIEAYNNGNREEFYDATEIELSNNYYKQTYNNEIF